MKQIFTYIALISMALSFASCDKDKEVNCNCNCQCCNSDNSGQTGGRPGNDDGNNGGTTGDPVDRDEYDPYSNTFTRAIATYWGQYYEDQPSNIANWYVELAEDDYDIENHTGEGYNIALEFFANEGSIASIPTGTYSVEEFDSANFSAGSLLYGFGSEDEETGNVYTEGTWLFKGNEGIAAATAGWVKVEKSGAEYTITYELYDDEYLIKFTGRYSGSVDVYDGTQEESNISAAQVNKVPRATKSNVKYYKVRR